MRRKRPNDTNPTKAIKPPKEFVAVIKEPIPNIINEIEIQVLDIPK